jgi:hypothetical protein
MNPSLICAAVLLSVTGAVGAPKTTSSIYESPIPATPANHIDRLVFEKLSTLKIEPVLCSDAVFVRRAYLDVIGSLPTAEEAREFIRDPDSQNKRRLLIDRLLARDEFADYWAMKWSDILRIKAEFPVNLWPNAAQVYHRWVRTSIAENKPYDKFVRDMLTSSGSNFRVGPVNFYRAVPNRTPDGIASAVALAFMGSRTDSWPKARLAGMAVFFSQIGYKPTNEWKEEDVIWDPLHSTELASNIAPGKDAIVPPASKNKPEQPAADAAPSPPDPPKPGKPMTAVFPDGTKVTLSPNKDPREVFADWLISSKNPWFARSIVNRVWGWLLGRGIIHEPDDIRPDNPPSNPALLAYLEKELIASNYDLKHLYRLILSSRTYQFSSMPRFKDPQAAANFASYPHRRLEAEVLIDAVNRITGTSDLYTSAIPEPFTYIPRDKPAVALADGSITSSFLTLFGRSARATGMENERINKPVPAQWLHMLNSSHIQHKLEQGPKLTAIIDSGRKPQEIAEELYLTILSRFPMPDELQDVEGFGKFTPPPVPEKPASPGKSAKSGKAVKPPKPVKVDRATLAKRHESWIDIAWALINSTEFLYRH